MNRILLLRAPDHAGRANRLKSALEGPNLAVDETTPDPIDLSAAKRARARSTCLLLCWSPSLVLEGTPWEKIVAKAMQQKRCVTVLFEPGEALDADKPVDLTRWRGGSAAPALAVIRDRTGTFFADQRRRRWRRLGFAGAPSVLVVIGFYADVGSVSTSTCQVGWIRPVCGRLGLGGVPSPAQELAYQTALANGCNGLRDFVRSQPDNPRAVDAQRMLAGARTVERTSWHSGDRRLPLFVTGPARRTREVAEGAARTDAGQSAAALCSSYEATRTMRLNASHVNSGRLNCERSSDGWRCSIEGTASCRIAIPRVETVEICR
jgi:hypothetical protein